MPDFVPVPLRASAVAVDAAPGTEIILRGSLYSRHDGARIDAASTSWPGDAPGGASVDSGGLFDFEAGGFHLVSHDTASHEVHAVATGNPGPACDTLQVPSPCLPLRVGIQARSRLLDTAEWQSSLSGGIEMQVDSPPPWTPPPGLAAWLPSAPVAGFAAGAVFALVIAWRTWRAHARTPAARLASLARRVRRKLSRSAPLLSATLSPALESTLRAVKQGQVDAASIHGLRICSTLEQLEQTIDHETSRQRTAAEKDRADDLAREVEIALDAAREVARLHV